MRAIFIASLLFLFNSPSYCGSVSISSDPASWRLENYVLGGQSVVLWYTGSACSNGNISLPSSATVADMNRLWYTVSLAKTTGAKIFLYYDDANAPQSCQIISFGVREGG